MDKQAVDMSIGEIPIAMPQEWWDLFVDLESEDRAMILAAMSGQMMLALQGLLIIKEKENKNE